MSEVSTGFSDSTPDYDDTAVILVTHCRIRSHIKDSRYHYHRSKGTVSCPRQVRYSQKGESTGRKKKIKVRITDQGVFENSTTSRIREFQKLKRVKLTAIFYANTQGRNSSRWIRNVSFVLPYPFVKHRGVIFAQLRARVYTNSELLRAPRHRVVSSNAV